MLTMIQDCREKHSHHNNIEMYCLKNNVPIIRKKLNVGDYRLADVENGEIKYLNDISVDLKGGGLAELANDLYQDKLAYHKKYKKCLKDKIQLIVLVEEPIKSMNDIYNWKSKYSRITGRFLSKLIREVNSVYGVKFYFCEKKDVGKIVFQLLMPKNQPVANDKH